MDTSPLPALGVASPGPAREGGEGELLRRLREKDSRAVEELVGRYEPYVRRLVFRLSGWSARREAEDLVQEVFVLVVERIGKFEGRSSLSTWIGGIVVNVCRGERRKRLFRAQFWQAWGRGFSAGEPAQASVGAERDERAETVVAAVRGLPVKYREVVVLRYLEGMEMSEVAQATGTSKGTAEVRLSRAREMLRAELKDLEQDLRE